MPSEPTMSTFSRILTETNMKSKLTKSTKNGISPNQMHPQFGISNEITRFPVNLQNSALEISASLMMNGTQKRSFVPYFEKLI